MSQTINPIQPAVQTPQVNSASKNDSDSDKSPSTSKVGPAVVLNLSNTKGSDMAQGDPDGDGH